MDPGLVSREDGRPSISDTDAQSETSGENPQGETKAVIRRYHGVMEDEGADDVFLPPPPPLPPSSRAPLLPAESSTGGMVNNSSVTHSAGATDATEDRANPSGLDWHHGERQLMAAQTKEDEVIARGTETSEECESNLKVLTPSADEDQTSSEDTFCLMETCQDPSEEEAEDVAMGTETQEDIYSLTETDSDVPTLPVLTGKDDDSEPSGPDTSQPQVTETPAEETDSDEDHVDTRSLNYKSTKSDWVRRESGSSETQVSQQPNSEDSEGTTRTEGGTGDGCRRIATDIQQGEKLLQRLQLVQQRQDGQMMETAQETRGKEQKEFETEVDPREVNRTDGAEMQEKRIHTAVDEGAEVNVTEKEKKESRKERVSSSTDDSDEDPSDRWEAAHEIPKVSSQHRFSAADTSMEKQIQEENQAKQNLQRSGAVFNLTDNPDVLEIPFKTNISLEPLPSQGDQRSDWQFSEHKMQKEISQEIQRELVLVSQGKIPGGYSKEEIRKLEETKLLFEAFQQDNPEGPTRLRKHPTTLIRGDVNPTVLVRTWSLERFSLESSLRLHRSETSEKAEKSPDYLRSRSPTGGSRDKTRLSPYAKQDKHSRLCRSMDSISSGGPTSAAEVRSKSREGGESPVLQRNPFFKLRPSLALQPEVERDIRQAREREEELRRQRSSLYGENRRSSREEEKSGVTQTLEADVRKQSRGKLERVWPPPSRRDQQKSEQSQQEPKVHRAGGQKAPLWQRWESGQINGDQTSQEDK